MPYFFSFMVYNCVRDALFISCVSPLNVHSNYARLGLLLTGLTRPLRVKMWIRGKCFGLEEYFRWLSYDRRDEEDDEDRPVNSYKSLILLKMSLSRPVMFRLPPEIIIRRNYRRKRG